jgi:hypothetical protein
MKSTSFQMFQKETGILPEVEKLDFNRLKYKLMQNEDDRTWTFEKCELAEREYKRYLTLIKLFPGKEIVPTKLMDAFWHQHILDTVAYQNDCSVVFGHFIHHFPYFGINGPDDKMKLDASFEETRQMYQEVFQEEIITAEASRCQDHACHATSDCACRVSGECKNFKP